MMSLLYRPLLWLWLISFGVNVYPAFAYDSPIAIEAEILASEDRDPAWFTQGLYRDQNGFFISSGLYGRSLLVYHSAERDIRYSLPSWYFAEGLTVIGDNIYLLTWKEKTLLVFDKKTFKQKTTFSYEGEGWGLTHNDTAFIMSNGSNQLVFRDQQNFRVQRTLTVKELDGINELEYVSDVVWANRWYDDSIYAIDSKSGCLLAKINLRPLRELATTPNPDHIANGIAYDKARQGLWVTGKYWSKRFLIRLPSLESRAC